MSTQVLHLTGQELSVLPNGVQQISGLQQFYAGANRRVTHSPANLQTAVTVVADLLYILASRVCKSAVAHTAHAICCMQF